MKKVVGTALALMLLPSLVACSSTETTANTANAAADANLVDNAAADASANATGYSNDAFGNGAAANATAP